MGIPGLARRLEPYATTCSPEQLDGYSAVIDGPALAYYSHKLALAASGSPTRLPSYEDVITAAMHWLSALEQINIKVSIILFDGALPASKRTERLSRLQQNNRRVQQLRASYPTASCPVPTYLGAIAYAFLAPALKEALAESAFASRTHIVPGEADDWCAMHAKDNAQSIIFTSDTDLILYEYPTETLIVFLHDADLSAGIKAYSPEQMRQQLQLKSLIPFAYALLSGPQDPTNDLVRNARGVNPESAEYMDFSRRYIVQVVTPAHLPSTVGSPLTLPELDVRVSEFVHQALTGSINPLVYLPLLVEDPNQASAWKMGQDVRTVAYSLLATRHLTVQEYRRKAQGITVQEISTYAVMNVRIPVTELEREVSALTEWATFRCVRSELLWPLFALSLVLAELNTPPSVALVLRVLNGDSDNTWAFIQLTARIQAAMYSLRMVSQVVRVWITLNVGGDGKLYSCVSSLQKQMKGFPSIPAMFSIPGQSMKVLADHEKLKELVEEIYASAGAEVPTEQISNKKNKRQIREADRKKRKAEQRLQPNAQISNAFGMLTTD
ncbi:hypothetical protein EJ02DRAFT_454038 [Clathrospora elynae]|uniref:Asteroid domain-containing protein n=1 Tax=Clathrospora elynae TaxID=706981 RepID=A0A6A5SRL6_9PLEO|nr:hypothetical protein EJ02DRAFT_454038 [Clathrospora elynae]